MIKNKTIREELYHKNKSIRKVGVTCKCPSCGGTFVKKSWQQKFCCGSCKDFFHNSNGDRHSPFYYNMYNMKHPERLARVGIYVTPRMEYMDDVDRHYASMYECEDAHPYSTEALGQD